MGNTIRQLFQFVVDLALHSPYRTTPRVRVVKSILWFFAGVGAVAAAARLLHGLGATTHLSDVTPWGLWIGFDVVGGVALAAGGFVIAATVYIFHLHRYHAIVRPAVLTAFLGYAAVIVGLIFDLGLWWNIWRPTIFWQHHSALFEVAWCVMLYFTVLAFEFAPVVLEKMPFPRLFRVFKALTLPMVILGIMLSTLHQSSLGTLFLIMPFRLHPLWYSGLQPLLFFISAIGLGLAMVTLESLVSGWLYQRPDELPLLSGLAKACAITLGLYTAIRLGDLAVHGKLVYFLSPSWETAVFSLEMLMCAIIPLVLFSIPAVRQSKAGLFTGAAIAVAGFVFNRIAVSGISTISTTGTSYFPAWTEFAISLGVVAGAGLVFFFLVEHFSVYETPTAAVSDPISPPAADPVSGVRVTSPWAGDFALYSLIFVLAAGIAFYFLPEDAISGAKPRATAVDSVRMISAHKEKGPEEPFARLALVESALSGDTAHPPVQALLLDANRDGRFVLFDHDGHQERQGGKTSCGLCHHLNRPFDQATSCAECHRDMYLATDIFQHQRHVEKMGQNQACPKCHVNPDLPKNRQTATPCLSCHRRMFSPGSRVVLKDNSLQRPAVGYMQAMHGLCQKCHQENAGKRPELTENFARCVACHQESDPDYLRRLPLYPAPENTTGVSADTSGGGDRLASSWSARPDAGGLKTR